MGFETGVSATHLDWTMVPYVRKSFLKHFKTGARYMKGLKGKLSDYDDSMAIDDERYQASGDVYTYAMDQTEKELKQAVEGMYHNLNKLGRHNSNVMNIAA